MLKSGGAWYATLFAVRAITDRLRDRLDDRLATIERRKSLVEPWTISARRFTSDELRKLYNTYDWTTRGDEWTPSEEWKRGLTEEFMFPNIPAAGSVVEIGPGAGRWTEVLQKRAGRLIVTDVSERSIAFCRDRFHDSSNVEYLLGDGRTLAVPDQTVDFIWSFDVFVHVNPIDARSYFKEFFRVLKPGGRAVIHHPGAQRLNPSRSDLTDAMVRSFCEEAGLRVVVQTPRYTDHNPGDLLSLMERPAQ